MIFVLDASAMIAFLRDEPGAHVVSEALFDPRTQCHAHAFHRAAGREEALRAVADLARLGVMQDAALTPAIWQAAGAPKANLRRLQSN